MRNPIPSPRRVRRLLTLGTQGRTSVLNALNEGGSTC